MQFYFRKFFYIFIWLPIWPHVAISMAAGISDLENYHLVHIAGILKALWNLLWGWKGTAITPGLVMSAETCLCLETTFLCPCWCVRSCLFVKWESKSRTNGQTKKLFLKHVCVCLYIYICIYLNINIYIYRIDYVIGFTADLRTFSQFPHLLYWTIWRLTQWLFMYIITAISTEIKS